VVIEFKRDVYQRALQELSRFLTWPANGQGERRHSSRYLRQPHERRGQDRGNGGPGANGNGGNGGGGGAANAQSGNKQAVNASSKAVVAASKAIADAAGSSKLVLARDKE
jgi:putative (di)nucleoside polyphosphate hydrolase